MSAAGILRGARELHTLSFFEENSECFPKLFPNSERARHKACFLSFFLSVFVVVVVSCLSRPVTPGTWDLLEQRLCISSSVSPRGQLLLPHALLDCHPHSRLCGTQEEEKAKFSSIRFRPVRLRTVRKRLASLQFLGNS